MPGIYATQQMALTMNMMGAIGKIFKIGTRVENIEYTVTVFYENESLSYIMK